MAKKARRAGASARRLRIGRMSDENLLKVRLRHLPTRLKGTPLPRRIRILFRELQARNIDWRPHIWISEEFFTPDGVPGFAIPFYLTHPRLMRLERKQMLALEGGTEEECMKIFRHETGHALDNAYGLHLRKDWREIFGPFSRAYPKSYKPNPTSRHHVLHLDGWYAQAHPAEDWAETFAVWLKPGGRWRSRYKGWPALKKLEYVDWLIKKIADNPPKNRTRTRDEPIAKIPTTLQQHYNRKRKLYSLEYPAFYDRDLRRIFSSEKKYKSRPSAVKFLRRYRTDFRQIVAEGTGVYSYTIDHVLRNIIDRARELKLHVAFSEKVTRQQTMIMLTVHTMNIVHSGRYRFHYGL